MSQTLLENIHTKSQKDAVLEELEILLDAIYQNRGEGLEIALKNHVRSWVAQILRLEFAKEGVNREDYLKNLKNDINSFRELKLAIAFEPSDASIERFSFFIKKHIGEKVLLDLVYDPKILGGCVIIFEGNYRDFSLKRVFDAEFEKMRESIAAQLRESNPHLIKKEVNHNGQDVKQTSLQPQIQAN